MSSLDDAVKHQMQAYNLFSEIEKYSTSDFLTNILINLAEMQEKANKLPEALGTLIQACEILT